jgi:hypothetical protein
MPISYVDLTPSEHRVEMARAGEYICWQYAYSTMFDSMRAELLCHRHADQNKAGEVEPGPQTLESLPFVSGGFPIVGRMVRVPLAGCEIDRDVEDEG